MDYFSHTTQELLHLGPGQPGYNGPSGYVAHLSADDQLTFSRQRGFGGTLPQASTLSYWLDVLKLSISSGFARFGWMNVTAPEWQAYVWWGGIVVTALLGLQIILKGARNSRQKLLLITLFIWTAGVLAIYLRLNANRFQPQFRFAFPLLPIVCTFAAAGWLRVARRFTRKDVFAVGLPLALLVIVNLYLIIAVIVPAYR